MTPQEIVAFNESGYFAAAKLMSWRGYPLRLALSVMIEQDPGCTRLHAQAARDFVAGFEKLANAA